jgi:hypothetical protein
MGLIVALVTLIFGARWCRAQEILLPNAERPVAVNGPLEIFYSDHPGAGKGAMEASTWHSLPSV